MRYITLQNLIYIITIFSFVNILFILILFLFKSAESRKLKVFRINREYFIANFIKTSDIKPELIPGRKINTLFKVYMNIEKSITIEKDKKNKIEEIFIKFGLQDRYIRELNSNSRLKRIKASIFLSYFSNDKSRKALENKLADEKKYSVSIYIIAALVRLDSKDSIPFIISKIENSPKWFYKKIIDIVKSMGQNLYEYIKNNLLDSDNTAVKLLIVKFSSIYIASELRNYLIDKSKDDNSDIKYASLNALSRLYKNDLLNNENINSEDPAVKNIILTVRDNEASKENIINIIKHLADESTRKTAITTLSLIAKNNPRIIDFLIDTAVNEVNIDIKKALCMVISEKTDYFLLKLISNDNKMPLKAVKMLLKFNITADIINFLNRNRNIELENYILTIIEGLLHDNKILRNELSLYLDERILKKLQITKDEVLTSKKSGRMEKGKLIFLISALIFSLGFVPLFYFIRILINPENYEGITGFLLSFNYFFMYYSLVINSIYIIILFFSIIGLFQQKVLWELKSFPFLFRNNLLPSISIIAPAFNEEKNIIESVSSLLNLEYSNYNLIVVNDGSKDSTLKKLIEYFKLEKSDYYFNESIKTMRIRGIYLSRHFSRLIVVDKENGGKADSLNAGINISDSEFVCGIDADSILDSDALLKLVSLQVDKDSEVVASGGNILPVNGCEIERGMIKKVKIPSSSIARFQFIEYIRAFLAGRVGWAYINSLLIISGAFGLFKRERLLEIGGYLTENSVNKRDTVGEDMELVVRLTKYMRKNKLDYTIDYSYNASCRTEVPENFSTLIKQRDRWQRGLIDILYYHRDMICNIKYGAAGLIAMPYYFIFEFLGPIIEAQGYIIFFMSLFLGILSREFSILFFFSAILYGIFISIASQILSESGVERNSFKETSVIIFYAVIENFGYRQFMSLLRVLGFINALRNKTGWGIMRRKGFK